MSVEALNLVWELSKAEPASARLVLVFLADRASGPSLECWPTIPQIEAMTGVDARSIRRAIQHLEAIGELQIDRTRRNNVYRIALSNEGAGTPNRASEWGRGHPQSAERMGTPAPPMVPLIEDTGAHDWGRRHPPNPKQPKERSAPQRPTSEADESSAPALGAPGRAAPRGSAGALGASDVEPAEQVRDLQRRGDAMEVERMLARVQWLQAPQDRQTVPGPLAQRLAGSKHATPMRVAYAIKAIDERCRKAARKGEEINPLGMLVAALGAQEKNPGKPWDIPPEFVAKWERNGLDRARVQDLKDLIARKNAENRPRDAVG